MEIIVTYTSLDRVYKRRKYKTLKGARAFAQKWVGETPELGSSYAASFDGIGTIEVEGCPLLDLFPEHADAKEDAQQAAWEAEQAEQHKAIEDAEAAQYAEFMGYDQPTAPPKPRPVYTFDSPEEAEEAYQWACESWSEQYAEAGSSFVFGGGHSHDANLAASQAVGPRPDRAQFGLPPLPKPTPRPLVSNPPDDDAEIPF